MGNSDITAPERIWANVTTWGDMRPLCGEWNHCDVGSVEDVEYVRADRLTALQDRVNELETVASRAIEEWAGWVDDQLSSTGMYSDAMAEVDAASAVLAKGEKG